MSELKTKGYKRYDYMKELYYEGIEKDFEILRDYFRNDLPEDDYAKGLNRYRRYSRALVLPTSQQIEWHQTFKKTVKNMQLISKVNLTQNTRVITVNSQQLMIIF